MRTIHDSELILNQDGSVYHLNLLPEDIADTIITVGDPDRVPEVSKHFDRIEIKKQKRELITHTGYIGKKRCTVLSTGMSTDNIDIVMNELDALVNIDLQNRIIKPQLKSLNIIRIGTAGGLSKHLNIDDTVVSEFGIGMDGLGSFYKLANSAIEEEIRAEFLKHFEWSPIVANTYAVEGSYSLLTALRKDWHVGMTATCGGFYGPQARTLRAEPSLPDLIEKLQSFNYENHTITNFEMETAGLYAMGRLLGHHCCSVSAIVANRCTRKFSTDAHKTVQKLIQDTLEKIGALEVEHT
jgi:uridine phosphorylase